MNTREIAAEYRLAHWAGIIRERTESGQSIKSYCESIGIRENSYYYWQKKLREAACGEMIPAIQTEKRIIPAGWAVCGVTERRSEEKAVTIEIGKCRVKATAEMDTETLMKVCRVLVSIC